MSAPTSAMPLIPDLVAQVAAERGGDIAFRVDNGASITLEDWHTRANAFARGLLDRGVRPGERVLLRFDNARFTDYVVAWLGTHRAGAVSVPISSRFSRSELAHVIINSEPVGLVGPSDLLLPDLDLWVSDSSQVGTGRSCDDPGVPIAREDLADILYTSGTTGLPKGVATSHANLSAFAAMGGGSSGLFALLAGGGDRLPVLLHSFPVSTFAGSHGMVILPLQAALTGLAMSSWDAQRCCELIEEYQVDLTYLVPAMAMLLLRSGAPERHDVSSVRVQMWGGSAVPGEVLKSLTTQFPGTTQLNIYGLTEGGPAVTIMPYDPDNPTSIGRPSGITEVSVRDEGNEAVATGESGEICLRLPGVPTRHYHKDPEASAAVWTDGWIHTGDIGYQDEAGLLYLVDRLKDLIIRGGHNLSTLEIESVLLEHPAVAEAAVFGISHDVLGEDVAAALVLSGEVSEDELIEHCRRHLSGNKVPRRWLFRDSLPRNAMGKSLKRALRLEAEKTG